MMIDYAINIEPLYPGLTIYEKIRKVSAAGFHAIEFWSWDDRDLQKMKQVCEECQITVRAFSATKDYSLCDVSHRESYLDWVKQSIAAAKILACDTLILFPNHFTLNGCADFRNQYSREGMIANITATLMQMLPMLEENEITVLLEPLCNIGADAGMSVTDTSVGADIVRAVNSPYVKLLCDVFHMQVMHGNLLPNIVKNLDLVPYIHIADAPDRHEPGTGEIDFDYLLEKVEKQGFEGTICFEYFPKGDTEEGFETVKKYCK